MSKNNVDAATNTDCLTPMQENSVPIQELSKTLDEMHIIADEIVSINETSENETYPEAKTKYLSELHIVDFDPDTGINVSSWLKYFNTKCNEARKDDEWKLRNIGNFLRGSAIKEYINSCLEINDWQELCQIIVEKFLKPVSTSFSDFSQLTFNSKNDLNSYFHTKVEAGGQLGLSTPLILEGLSDGLPINMRQLMVISPPANPTEWLTIATKLLKIQDRPVSENKTINSINQQVGQNNNFTSKQRYFPPYGLRQERTWRPIFQQPISQTFQNSTNTGFTRPHRYERPKPTNFNVHCHSELPPSPCRLCTKQGIMNAYHWVQTCPFYDPIESQSFHETANL